MKALSIRNLPDEIYESFKRMASENHRSMQEQVRLLIEREIRLSASPGLVAASKWRERLAGRSLGDTVKDVRLDRARQ